MKIEIETRQAEITPTATDSDTDTATSDTATSDTATESTEPTAMKLEGYALVFDTPAQIDSYTEIISKDALNGCDLSDVSFFVNHGQTDIPLARTPDTLNGGTSQHRTCANGIRGSQARRPARLQFCF